MRLPPGLAKLSTNPSATGSVPILKMTGIVFVAFLKATASGVEEATRTSTLRRTKSSAKAGYRSSLLSAKRVYIAELAESCPEHLAPGA